MYCGDEIRAVVVDVGSYTTKLGESGEGNPRRVFSSAVASKSVEVTQISPSEQTGDSTSTSAAQPTSGGARRRKQFVVGNTAARIDGSDKTISSFVDEDGFVNDWDAMEALWTHALCSKQLIHEPDQNPLLLADPVLNPAKCRLKQAELLYEKFNIPALMMANQAVLAAFSVGRSCSLVLNAGHQHTTIAPVFDGHLLTKGVRKTRVAGDALNRELLSALTSQGQSVVPFFDLKASVEAGKKKLSKAPAVGVSASLRTFHRLEIMRDLKESWCEISLSLDHENTGDSFVLPDGTKVDVHNYRWSVPELWLSGSRQLGTETGESLPALIGNSLKACSVDIRKELGGAITLCGGTCAFKGLSQRLVYELTQRFSASSLKPRCISPATPEKINAAWVGGSILASLGSFQQKWCSKQEYDELGASNALLKRCAL